MRTYGRDNYNYGDKPLSKWGYVGLALMLVGTLILILF